MFRITALIEQCVYHHIIKKEVFVLAKNWIIEEIGVSRLKGALSDFQRRQEVKQCLRRVNGEWVLRPIAFIDDWDEKCKAETEQELVHCIQSGGKVWGILNGKGKLIAFASLKPDCWGSSGSYLQLSMLHVSAEYRNQGIGKQLFAQCAAEARLRGADKLYISAHSAWESQQFYLNAGCVDAEEINSVLAGKEPCDRQMEYALR